MIYEIRIYSIIPGRIPDALARFEKYLPSLFARHGIIQVGGWTSFSGNGGPCFVYALAYTDLATREAQWQAFYADDEWWKIRTETNDGEEMVDRFELHFVRSSALTINVIGTEAAQVHGIQELAIAEMALGRTAEAAHFITDALMPRIKDSGGQVLLIGDLIAGSNLPKMAWLIAWPDAEAQRAGQITVDSDAFIGAAFKHQRVTFGRSLVGRIDRWLLEPTAFKLPDPDMGRLAV